MTEVTAARKSTDTTKVVDDNKPVRVDHIENKETHIITKPAVDIIAKNKATVTQAAQRMRRASMGAISAEREVEKDLSAVTKSLFMTSGGSGKTPQVGGTSDVQRSSGYGNSPSNSSGKRRASDMFANIVLEASPTISSTINLALTTAPPPVPEPEPTTEPSKTTNRRTSVHINKNIQHIKTLQEAAKLAAQTGVPTKMLLAQKRRESLMVNSSSKSTSAMLETNKTESNTVLSGRSRSASNVLSGSNSTRIETIAEGAHDWSNKATHANHVHLPPLDEYELPTVSSPEGDNENDENAEDAEFQPSESAHNNPDHENANIQETDSSQQVSEQRHDMVEHGIAEEKSPADPHEAHVGAHHSDTHSSESTKLGKLSKSTKKGRMSDLEALVPDMYRPVSHIDPHEQALRAKELAKKKAKEEQEAAEARAKEERETLKVLDFANYDLESLNLSEISVLQNSPKAFSNILVLILRSNRLFDMSELGLLKLTRLTDLDLGSNRLVGPIPRQCIPPTVERLDMSYNQITDISELFHVTALRVLNVKNNSIKTLQTLPQGLQSLDITFNLLSSTIHLRLLSLSPKLTTLSIAGNPITQSNTDIKSIVSSMLPSVLTLDKVTQPGHKIRSSDVKGLKSKNHGGTPDPVNAIALNRFNSSVKTGKETIHAISPPASPTSKSRAAAVYKTEKDNKEEKSVPLWQKNMENNRAAAAAAAAQQPKSRKEQVELDRSRVAIHTLKQEVLQEAKMKQLEEEQQKIAPYQKKLAPDAVNKLLFRLTFNGKRQVRDPAFHQAFMRSAAGRALSPKRPFYNNSRHLKPSKTEIERLPKSYQDFADERSKHTEAAGVIHHWINERVLEQGKLSSVLSVLFKHTSATPTSDKVEGVKLSKALDKILQQIRAISFLRNIDLPIHVEEALSVFNTDDNNAAILVELAACIEQLAMLSAMLLDIEALVAEVNNGLYASLEAGMLLQRGIEDIMTTGNGAQVNATILTSFSCEYRSWKKIASDPANTLNKGNSIEEGTEFSGDMQALVQSTLSPEGSPVVKPTKNAEIVPIAASKLDTAVVQSTVDSLKERLQRRAERSALGAGSAMINTFATIEEKPINPAIAVKQPRTSLKITTTPGSGVTPPTVIPTAPTLPTLSTISPEIIIENNSNIQTTNHVQNMNEAVTEPVAAPTFVASSRTAENDKAFKLDAIKLSTSSSTNSLTAFMESSSRIAPTIVALDSHELTSATVALSNKLDDLLNTSSSLPAVLSTFTPTKNVSVIDDEPEKRDIQEQAKDAEEEEEEEPQRQAVDDDLSGAMMSAYDRHLALLYGGGSSNNTAEVIVETVSPAVIPASEASASGISAEPTTQTAVTTHEDDTPAGGNSPALSKMSAKDRIKARMEAKRQAKEA